jgi:NADPH2:quinone reductase
MRTHAIRIHKNGGPEALRYEEVELPPPGPDEVRIGHAAIGVNFIDIYHRTGLYPQNLPFTPGTEGAGVVEETGVNVRDLKPGDHVGYCSGPPGAYAGARNLPVHRLIPLRPALPFEVAASVLLQGLTTHYLIHDCYKVEKGSVILLHAAAGGVGTLLSQWAQALGAEVIGTAGSDEKAALARRQGCAHVINYRSEDFVERVKQITKGHGVDAVYDGVGADTFMKSLDCLRPRGTMVTFGNASGKVPPFEPALLSTKGSLILTRPSLVHFIADRSEMLRRAGDLFAALESGTVKLSKPQTFDLHDAARAHEALEGRHTTGKVLLKP